MPSRSTLALLHSVRFFLILFTYISPGGNLPSSEYDHFVHLKVQSFVCVSVTDERPKNLSRTIPINRLEPNEGEMVHRPGGVARFWYLRSDCSDDCWNLSKVNDVNCAGKDRLR